MKMIKTMLTCAFIWLLIWSAVEVLGISSPPYIALVGWFGGIAQAICMYIYAKQDLDNA
jgi:hypothetical protein